MKEKKNIVSIGTENTILNKLFGKKNEKILLLVIALTVP